MLLLLATGTAATGGFPVVRLTATGVAGVIVAGNAIAGRELDFQLNDFIPLLVCPVPLGNRQKLAQATTIVVRGRSGRGNGGRVFWV